MDDESEGGICLDNITVHPFPLPIPLSSRESSPGPELTAEERDARTVFVMQLSNRLKQRELAEFFEQAGKVRKAVIIYDKKSGRSKG